MGLCVHIDLVHGLTKMCKKLYLPLPLYESLPFYTWHHRSLGKHPLIRNLTWSRWAWRSIGNPNFNNHHKYFLPRPWRFLEGAGPFYPNLAIYCIILTNNFNLSTQGHFANDSLYTFRCLNWLWSLPCNTEFQIYIKVRTFHSWLHQPSLK